MTSIHWVHMAAQTNHNTTTIIIINHKESTLPITCAEMYIIATIPPNTIQYNPTTEWPKYLHQLENQYTTIIRIHKHGPSSVNPQIPNALISNIISLYNIKINNNPTQTIPHMKKIKYSSAWQQASQYNHSEINHSAHHLPTELYNIHPLKFKPQQCIYIDGSFIIPDEHGIGNTTGSGVYSPANNIRIADRLPGLQNILRAQLNAILIAIQSTQYHTRDIHIFTNNLNSIYLINNRIRHPSSQHNHPDKLLIAAIVIHITWFTQKSQSTYKHNRQ